MIDFVKQTVSSTLPLLLREVLKQLVTELRPPSTSRRLHRQLVLFGLEVDALCVLLTEAMPSVAGTEDENVPAQTREHLSGIPPPMNRFLYGDGTVTEHG
jgi:hypothetical protein